MKKEDQNEYESIEEKVLELICRWEKICPEEELVVMTLPKFDQTEREQRIKLISEMLLNERWNTSIGQIMKKRNDVGRKDDCDHSE